MQQGRGFTLIELLIVLALIAILAAVLIVVINPTKIFRNARDTQRTGDLRNLDTALTAYITENAQTGSIYLGSTSSNANCVGGGSARIFSSVTGISGTATSADGVTSMTAVGSTSTAINGTGWLPVDFSKVTVLQLTALPLDPLNTLNPSYYYTYACKTDFTYELNARMEARPADKDGGDAPFLYEVGPNKGILPNATSAAFYPNW